MKKKELLAMPKLMPTQYMIKKAKENEKDAEYRPRYTRYYKAIVKNGILKVAIWTRSDLAKGIKEPTYLVFIDKEKDSWINYNMSANGWGKARIENLNYDGHRGNDYDWYGVRGWESEETRTIVNKYFETGMQMLTRDAIKKWQKEHADTLLQRKYQSEIEQIDSVMNLVPELPKDFENWWTTEAYYTAQYLIYDKKQKKAFCTNCWKDSECKKEYKHLGTANCPKCRHEIIFKSWNKQRIIKDRKKVGIVQELRDKSGYVLRIFDSQIQYRKENGYAKECWIHEDTRFRLTKDFTNVETFEWGEWKYTGQYRWCHELNRGMYYYYGPSEECICYNKNIEKILNETKGKYIPVGKIMKSKPGTYSNPARVLKNALDMPQVEMLAKVGLYNLAAEYLEEGTYGCKKWNKESPWKYLEITKDYFTIAKKINARKGHIEVMKKASQFHILLNEEQIEFYKKYYRSNAEKIFRLGHQEKMYKYLTRLEVLGTRVLADYLDYIDDLRKLHIPLTKSALFPKNFEDEHREVAELRREEENKIAAMELRKKNRALRKMLPEIRELYECENDDFKVVIPTCKKDFQDEGREQHNCVGGAYFDKMLKGDCVVVFLRQQDDLKKSFCTVEFAPNGSVRQNRIQYNKEAPEEAQKFINDLSAKVKKKLEKAMMEEIKKAEETLAYAT